MHSKKTTLINVRTKEKIDVVYDAKVLFEDENIAMKKIIKLISSGWRVISINKGTGIFIKNNEEIFIGDKLSYTEGNSIISGIVKVKSGRYVVVVDDKEILLNEILDEII